MPDRLVVPNIEALPDFIDTPIGPSEWITVDQTRIDAFARATGDDQWIHTDSERAVRESPFGHTIAHGYLTLALAPVLLREIFSVDNCSQIINSGIDRLRLKEPVAAGSRLRLSGRILGVRRVPGGAARVNLSLSWELEGAKRPACRGEAIYVYFP